MIAQLISFTFITFNSFIWGAIVKRITSWNTSFYLDFLVGFATCNAILTLTSIFYPVNEQISLLLLAISGGILVFNLKWLKEYSKCLYTGLLLMIKSHYIWFLLAVMFVVILFFKSLYSPSLHYDAGLYHIQTIKWVSEYPTVKGLGNLNYTFGYNFNIFTWFAASSFNGFFKQPIYAVNFTLAFFFIFFIFSRITTSVKSRKYFFATSYLLILYSTIYHYCPHISTTSNNISVFIIVTTIFIFLIEFDKRVDILFPIVVLSIYCITIKISALPVILLLPYLFTKISFLRNGRKYIGCLVLCCFILIPWLYKNVILTGWIIYPIYYMDFFSVDWKIPYEQIVQTKIMIKDFTQGGKSNWLIPWILNQNIIDLLFLSITLMLVCVVLLKIFKKNTIKNQTLIIGIFVSVLGVLFMFLNAPNLWYSMAFVCSTVLLSINFINLESDSYKFIFYIIAILLFGSFFIGNWFHPWHFTKQFSERYIVPYPSNKQVSSNFTFFLIDDKVKCYYPIHSDQCYDYDLPCTYKLNKGLHLRTTTIKDGFYYKANNWNAE